MINFNCKRAPLGRSGKGSYRLGRCHTRVVWNSGGALGGVVMAIMIDDIGKNTNRHPKHNTIGLTIKCFQIEKRGKLPMKIAG